MTYSFAKTPLKAAQAPLAAARGIQGTRAAAAVVLVGGVWFEGGGGGVWWVGGTATGIRGSASVSMPACGMGGRGRLFNGALWLVSVVEG